MVYLHFCSLFVHDVQLQLNTVLTQLVRIVELLLHIKQPAFNMTTYFYSQNIYKIQYVMCARKQGMSLLINLIYILPTS